MKRSKTTTVVLTCLLLFMFALFGGGSVLNALGIISIPFFDPSSESRTSTASTSSHNPSSAGITLPAGIQIYDPQTSVSSQVGTEDMESSTTIEDTNTDKDSSYKAELSGNTASSSVPANDNTSSMPGQETGSPNSTKPVTGSTPEDTTTETSSRGGIQQPSTRPEPTGPSGGNSRAIQSVALDQTEVTINRRNTLQLTAIVAPQNSKIKTVTWATSNKDVATVDSNGEVTGIGAGNVTITATAGQKSATCKVTVVVLMDGIALNHIKLSIDKGSTEQLTAKITPEDTTEDKTITWTSSDPEIISVDAEGKVKALKTGKATVKAAAVGASASCEVTVLSPMTGIALDKSTLTLNRNTTGTLTVNFLPVDTTSNREITWSSSAPEIADVDQQGNVIAYSIGTATITARCGEYTATCDVTVIALIEGIFLDQTEITLDRGTEGQLTASIVPLDTTEDKTITWISSNPDIATVDATGKVNGVKIGTTIITAKVGEHTASCNINVVALIHGITLDKSELTLDRDTTGQLAVSYDPPDTTEDKTVTWSSSDSTVATVDKAGNVTAVQIGTATITAQVGTHTTTCNITVVALIHGITLAKSELTLDRGTADQLTVSYDPPDTTEDKTITWSSSDPTVATVDATGKVTAVQIGATAITAKVGEHTASCTITVVALIHKIALDQTAFKINKGDGHQFTVIIDPPDTTDDKTVVWSSSNPAVATIGNDGKLLALTPGNTTITAKIGLHSATCDVRVRDSYAIMTAAIGNGSVSPGATIIEDNSITLTATPAVGHHFVSWSSSDGTVIDTATFNYVPDKNVTWTALFKIDTYDNTQVTIPTDTTGGAATVSPAAPYTYGQTVTYSATPAKGYHFVNWTSDKGNVETRQTFEWTLTGPIIWTPHFEGNTYPVTVKASSPERDIGGTATGAGTYRYGDKITLTATPEAYFTFVNWTSNFGDVITNQNFVYQFNDAAADANGVTWTANFKLNSISKIANISTTGPFNVAVRRGSIDLYANFTSDSYKAGSAVATLQLLTPIEVKKGQEAVSFIYDSSYYWSVRERAASVEIYDINNQLVTSQTFGYLKEDKAEDRSYSFIATQDVTIDHIIFKASAEGRYKASKDESSPIAFWIDNIYVGGQSAVPISGYNKT